MQSLTRFWKQPCSRYRNFQIVFTILTLNFIIPAFFYAVSPQTAIDTFVTLNNRLGGDPYTFDEAHSRIWRYLGAANVMTLGLMCLLMQINLRKYMVILVPLIFLKAYNATLFLCGFVAAPEYPALLVIAIFDYITSALFFFFSRRAYVEIGGISDEQLIPKPGW